MSKRERRRPYHPGPREIEAAIIDAMADTIWLVTYAGFVAEDRGVDLPYPGPGEDWEDHAWCPSADAEDELLHIVRSAAREIQKTNGAPLRALYKRIAQKTHGLLPGDFGQDLGHSLIGSGGSSGSDVGIRHPHVEFSLYRGDDGRVYTYPGSNVAFLRGRRQNPVRECKTCGLEHPEPDSPRLQDPPRPLGAPTTVRFIDGRWAVWDPDLAWEIGEEFDPLGGVVAWYATREEAEVALESFWDRKNPRKVEQPASMPREDDPRLVARGSDRCEICGRGADACRFEIACSCWRGIPCAGTGRVQRRRKNP